MLTSFPMILAVGTLLGFLTGLGIGGGSLLILWLTVVLDTDPQAARGINLLFFLPAALIACIFRAKQGALSIRKLLPAILAGAAAAAVFSWLSAVTDAELLRPCFGTVLLAAGARELLYKGRDRG